MSATSAQSSTNSFKPEIGCIIKLQAPKFNEHCRYYVVDKENIFPINEDEKQALEIFLKKTHPPEIGETVESLVRVTDITEYIFKRDYFVSFRKSGVDDWKTIIVTTEEVFGAFTRGDLYFENPMLLHEMTSLKSDGRVPRSISTYGFNEHEPSIECFDYYTNTSSGKSLEYVITSIDSIVPNIKPSVRFKDNDSDVENIYLHVDPVDGLKYNEEIYWFIDYKNMCVCQYEDGFPIRDLGEIILMKNK